MSQLKILGFAGSLRAKSYNRSLIEAAQILSPDSVSFQHYDLSGIPLYNGDVEEQGFPQPVVDFREAIAGSDALLIATPEYNYSIPGVLKNAIDWASRPPQPPLAAKPVAVIGATPGGFATVRAQLAFKQIATGPGMHVLPKPELLVSQAHEKFNENGELIDAGVKEELTKVIEALVEYATRLK